MILIDYCLRAIAIAGSRIRRGLYNAGMGSRQNELKWWRPRWSIRTLLIVVTLGCAYLACWAPTTTSGVTDLAAFLQTGPGNVTCRAPLLLESAVITPDSRSPLLRFVITRRDYYLWFFGCVAKLPYQNHDARPIDLYDLAGPTAISD